MNCIYCKAKCVKFGLYNNSKQRYKCKKCSKTFSDGTIDNFKVGKKKRLILHLILAGCHTKHIAEELEIEEKTIKKWKNSYFRSLNDILPVGPLLAIGTLKTIYSGIEKSRISKLHSLRPRWFRRFRK